MESHLGARVCPQQIKLSRPPRPAACKSPIPKCTLALRTRACCWNPKRIMDNNTHTPTMFISWLAAILRLAIKTALGPGSICGKANCFKARTRRDTQHWILKKNVEARTKTTTAIFESMEPRVSFCAGAHHALSPLERVMKINLIGVRFSSLVPLLRSALFSLDFFPFSACWFKQLCLLWGFYLFVLLLLAPSCSRCWRTACIWVSLFSFSHNIDFSRCYAHSISVE